MRLGKQLLVKYHMVIHLGCGVLVWAVMGQDLGWVGLMAAIVGSFFPDLEHFVFYYTYGRKTEYARTVKRLIREGDLKGYYNFCLNNHKKVQLYGHSLVSTVIVAGLIWLTSRSGVNYWGVFLVGALGHYGFDMFEDLMLLGKLNRNWYGPIAWVKNVF